MDAGVPMVPQGGNTSLCGGAVPDEAGVSHYGFGWRIGDGIQWHSGETIGFRNVTIRWPDKHLTVVLLSNRNDPAPYDTAIRIGALFGAD